MIPDYDSSPQLRGQILAASPSLMDPNFRETLVYITEHSPDGTLGLVLNRPIGRSFKEVVGEADFPDVLADIPVFLGGPVKPTNLLVAEFLPGERDDVITCKLTNQPHELEEFVAEGKGWLRAFIGYSGWNEGQLEGELMEDAWRVRRPSSVLFSHKTSGGLWNAYVGEDERWRKLLPHLPHYPNMN